VALRLSDSGQSDRAESASLSSPTLRAFIWSYCGEGTGLGLLAVVSLTSTSSLKLWCPVQCITGKRERVSLFHLHWVLSQCTMILDGHIAPLHAALGMNICVTVCCCPRVTTTMGSAFHTVSPYILPRTHPWVSAVAVTDGHPGNTKVSHVAILSIPAVD
jgi:hypothetical protein